MSIKVFSIDQDKVITSQFITAKTDYSFAINNLSPLIDKLDIQRNIQDSKFYRRLERDLVKGCIMPPLTLAFITDVLEFHSLEEAEQYITENIIDAFVLDGIQRLNTLQRTYKNNPDLDVSRPIFLNILFCRSMDNLLYRMITLNNGQKPMTARHQIEVLASNIYDFNDLPLAIQTERERKKRTIRGAFNKADMIKAYIAFLSNSTNIDNRRIIEEKLDELIAEKILNSNITEDDIEFSDVLTYIDMLCEDPDLLAWFKVNNNLIGFAVGIRKSFAYLMTIPREDFKITVQVFEKAFSAFDVSKVKLGEHRRKLVAHFIGVYDRLSGMDENEILDSLSEID
jgi:hypothetical protein